MGCGSLPFFLFLNINKMNMIKYWFLKLISYRPLKGGGKPKLIKDENPSGTHIIIFSDKRD